MHTAGVAELRGSDLAAEEDMLREKFGCDVGSLENRVLSSGWAAGPDRGHLPERESQKQNHQGNQEECRAFHSSSFRSECMVRDLNGESKTRDWDRANNAKELA